MKTVKIEGEVKEEFKRTALKRCHMEGREKQDLVLGVIDSSVANLGGAVCSIVVATAPSTATHLYDLCSTKLIKGAP